MKVKGKIVKPETETAEDAVRRAIARCKQDFSTPKSVAETSELLRRAARDVNRVSDINRELLGTRITV